ncbi:membrane bound O-acyl transferase family-domain-containing protein [Xylaria sp. CBS 124048]|nr:membrane bound O-acyl transferase family-domain-containing protein [Xylaria sp. CBS 124048]
MEQQQLEPDPAYTRRELYSSRVHADIAAGTVTPFIVPLHLLAYWIIPTLYLAIPHKNRPWLYSARWLILAGNLAFHWHMLEHVTSFNFPLSYVVGLIAAWTTIWNFTLLVWTRPQWDAKRVERRRVVRHGGRVDRDSPKSDLALLALLSSSCRNDHGSEESQPGAGEPDGKVLSTPADDVKPKSKLNGDGDGKVGGAEGGEALAAQTAILDGTEEEIDVKLALRDIASLKDHNGNQLQIDKKTALELYRLARDHEYEYYWQEYPADASFWTRLDWAFDIVSSFRLTGWNWAPSCFPPYELPPRIGRYQLPLEYMSHRSKQGYERTLSRSKFIISRCLFNILPSYIIADLCATLMTSDPYFIAGPEHNLPLPVHLASLHPVLLSLGRTVLGLVGMLSGLHLVWNCGAVVISLYGPPIIGFRAHPWHLPSLSGSWMQILDYGLSGFWGGWWHQTFRFGFLAPARWLVRHGYLPSPRNRNGSGDGNGNGNGNASKMGMMSPIITTLIAFAQSGLIHAAGSYSTVPPTNCWDPLFFFALSAVGVMLQSALSRVLRCQIQRLPRWTRRLGNFVVAFLWMWATSWVLLGDFGRSGSWLWEPVPYSFARAAGLGVDRRVWRFERDSLPRWYWGGRGRWWETGIAF